MRKFQCYPAVLAGKESKKLIRMYNKMAKTLVEFEALWYQAWVNSIEAAKSGLGASLLVNAARVGNSSTLLNDPAHLYVNFDWEILQLIRETRCLDRLGGLEIPETARMVLLQEQKFKMYVDELSHCVREYKRIVASVKTILTLLLKPHVESLQQKMKPGMIRLTWKSMNIEEFLKDIWSELAKFQHMVEAVNSIIDNRIDGNLKQLENVLLVNLPADGQLATLDEFVEMQEQHVEETVGLLMTKRGNRGSSR
jgi:dynein heavy chain